MSDDANTLLNDYEQLWQEQSNFRSLWNVAAQFCMPAWDNFIGEFAEGVNRNTRIFDSTAVIANERFAAAMEAMLTPRSQFWEKSVAADEALKDNLRVKRYMDQVTKIRFAARYHPEANFASQTDECYMSLGAYGNNALFIDEMMGHHIRYRSFPLSELVWSLNHQGMVDTIFRKFRYSARQAVQHWGNAVPDSIKKVMAKSQYTKFDFLHVVRPNSDHRPGSYGVKGKKFEGFYIFIGDRSVIEHGGYRTFPCAIGRYRVAPRESYGRGPATTCLPDVRTANEMVKTALRAGQKAVDPPILLAEESVLNNFNQRPGANNYGMLTEDGRALAQPFESKANFQLGEKLLDATRTVIRDTFLNTLFQILVENPNMTATEALLRAQEKGELIAPAMGRQQSEFLGPCIVRETDILAEAGQLPPPPMELLRSKRGMTVEYTSPLARALRAEEGTAIMNTVADIAQLSQLDPSAKLVMDFHDAARSMADIRGCPAKLLRTEEQVQALMQHAADQAQESQQVPNGLAVTTGVKNLAQAAAAANTAGGAGGAPSVSQAA